MHQSDRCRFSSPGEKDKVERKINLKLGLASGRRVSVRAVAGAPSVTVKILVFASIVSLLLSALPELWSQPLRGVSEPGVMARMRWSLSQ
ncbi:hypothetical protein Bca101_065929 [Brassica carinata]